MLTKSRPNRGQIQSKSVPSEIRVQRVTTPLNPPEHGGTV
jgi:hypothetical protein